MLRVKNTANDRTKSLLHRTAAKLEMEPVVNGYRLRMGSSVDIPEEVYDRNRAHFDKLIKDGVIEISYVDAKPSDKEPELNAEGLKLGGPTLERFMEAGYPADRYPPLGWAEVPSAGLTAYRKQVADDAARAEAEAVEKQAADDKEALAKALELQMAQQSLVAEQAPVTVSETVAVSDSLQVTTNTGSAGAPVEVTPAPTAPVVEEKVDASKKGPGKKKLI
jgi:hypothetical protein